MRNHSLLLAIVGIMTSMTAMAETATVQIDSEQSVSPLAECAKIVSNENRLACFDELAGVQNTQKRQLHLSSTLKSTISGNPQVVFGEVSDKSDKEEYSDQLVDSTNRKVLTEFGSSKEALEELSPLSLAYDLDKNSERGLWSARPHNANYLLPMYFNGSPNRHPTTPTQDQEHFSPNQMRVPELKFQLSLKSKTAENLFGTDADLWLGYTQVSHWQVYNEDNSRPFRAHDYEPEIFLTQPVVADLPFGGKLRMLGAGAVHHSNGESDPLSRSWNRVYLMGGAEWDRLTVVPRIWGRVLKKDDDIKPDDNPDILDYYGYGDVKFLYQLKSGSNLTGLVRFNPKTGKGAVQMDYVRPLGKGISGYVQLFHGYGQSLIDYNHEASSVGVGIMLNDWMGL